VGPTWGKLGKTSFPLRKRPLKKILGKRIGPRGGEYIWGRLSHKVGSPKEFGPLINSQA